MEIMVYNTLSRRKERFIPREQGKVGIYACGVTPYDYAHIGNARPPVFWDCARRFLRHLGYEPYLVQNFTDVDDKIIQRAQEKGVDPIGLAAKYARIYLEDLKALGVAEADVYPRVSEHIPEIIEMVKGLVDKGHAYEVNGDVYYAIETFPDYSKLSGRSLEEMAAGIRVEVNEDKRHPMDFALWKAAKPAEPAWDSPWGKGRPGWHIECSAMSLKYLGMGFDFHGGGVDLVFPHHENEIAQSEAYTGEAPFVRYWAHTAFINMGADKMSKSLGNFVTIREACDRFSPQVVRFWLISTHYRSPLSFGERELEASARGLERLETAWQNWEHLLEQPVTGGDDTQAGRIKELAALSKRRFLEAMADDFNTAQALGVLYELVREVNRWCQAGDFKVTTPGKQGLAEAQSALKEGGDILGIRLTAENDRSKSGLSDEEVEALISERQKARASRDFQTADRIRDRLQAERVILEDTPQGVRWRRG